MVTRPVIGIRKTKPEAGNFAIRKVKTRSMKQLFLLSALAVLLAGCAQKSEKTMKQSFEQIFPQGEKLPEQFSAYFIGQAWLAPLTHDATLGCPIANVTFELAQPLVRSNLGGNSRARLLSGKREAGTRTPPRRHSGNSGRCDPLARRRARQLVRPSGDHGRLRQQPQHLAGTGRRRTICSSDSEVKPADPSMTAARIDVRAALVSSTPGTPRRAGTPAGSKASGRHRRRTRPTASGR